MISVMHILLCVWPHMLCNKWIIMIHRPEKNGRKQRDATRLMRLIYDSCDSEKPTWRRRSRLYRMSLWYDLVTPLQILVTFILCMKQNTPVVNATNLYKTAKFEDFLSGSNRKSFYMIYYRPQLPSVRHCQRKEASMLWSHYEETRELPGERHCKEQCQVHAGEEDHARPG